MSNCARETTGKKKREGGREREEKKEGEREGARERNRKLKYCIYIVSRKILAC